MAATPLAVLVALALPALAQDPPKPAPPSADQAECTRIGAEMKKLAAGGGDGRKTTSISGAYAQYKKLLELGCALDYDAHEIGAQGAAAKGEIRARLRAIMAEKKACDAGPADHPCRTEEGQLSLAAQVAELVCNFADSKLAVEERRLADIKRADKKSGAKTDLLSYEQAPGFPFTLGSAAFAAVERAEAALYETGGYTDMIPAGTYTLDGVVIPVAVDKLAAGAKYKVSCTQ